MSGDLLVWLREITAAIAALGGVLIGALLTSLREVGARKHAFAKEQLQRFYAPLLGLRLEIRERSELRERLAESANREWNRILAEAHARGGVEEKQRVDKEQWPRFAKIIK